MCTPRVCGDGHTHMVPTGGPAGSCQTPREVICGSVSRTSGRSTGQEKESEGTIGAER